MMKFNRRKRPSRPPAESCRPIFESLEDRLLFSADLLPVPEMIENSEDIQYIEKDLSELFPVNHAEEISSIIYEHTEKLVIIDEGIENHQILASELSQANGEDIDIYIISESADGLAQISNILSKYKDIQSIEIFSHGNAQGLSIGNQFISQDNISQYQSLLSEWDNHLSEESDILLYGCNLAYGSEGRELLKTISNYTQTDVAASIDVTGSSHLGGDWELEYAIGNIESQQIISSSTNWQGALEATPSGGQVQVNTYTPGDQSVNTSGNAVAMDGSGNYVVVWKDSIQDGSGYGVFGQRFDSAGNPVGGEFQINTTVLDTQEHPSVSMNSSGEFVVVWQSYDGVNLENDIYAQRYDASGFAVGGEILVNSNTTDSHTNPDVAVTHSGGFIVTWVQHTTVNAQEVLFQRFDNTGTKVGSETTVNMTASGNQSAPAISVNKLDQFAISWHGNGVSDGSGVFVRAYNGSGTPVTSELLVNTLTTSTQMLSDVGIADDGTFAVTYESAMLDGSNYGVGVQRFDAFGSKVGSETLVNTTTLLGQYMPSISMNWTGKFVITWMDSSGADGGGTGIFVQEFDNAGNTVGGEKQVNTYSTNNQSFSHVAMGVTGDYVVVWSGEGPSEVGGVFAQLYKQPGANTAPTATNNTVATNEDVTYVFSASDFNFADVDGGDTLQQVQITSLETVGALKLNGIDLTLNQVISRADIDAGLLTFVPVSDQNGVGYDSYTFKVHDGTEYSAASYTMTIDVNAVNDLPTGNSNGTALYEDTPLAISPVSFIFNDVDIGDTLQQIQITSLETVGALKLNGVDVTLNQVITYADINAGLLTYASLPDEFGNSYDSIGFKVHDGTGYSVASYTTTFHVLSVNDKPTSMSHAVAMNEDTTYVYKASDFNFSDVDVGDSLQQVQITNLENVGDLKLNGVDVTLNQVISRADIDAGLLTFDPVANQNGGGYDSFSFKVHDGVDYSVSSYSMIMDVSAVNDAPTATNNTVATNEDVTYVFSAPDFNFNDVDVGDTLQQIQVTSLETVGALKLNGVDVTLNQVISRADIDAGLLTFAPISNQNGVGYDSFNFRVHDGSIYSATSYTLTIDVTPLNDLPTATNNTVSTNEDVTYVFSAADFNFADNDPGDTLQQVQITSLENVGALKLNGVDVTLNQVISRADVDAGLLTFVPVANQNGVGYDSFDFKVHDGTAYSAASYTLTIDVSSVADLPTATNSTVVTNEDVTYVFNASDFNFADNDPGDTLQQVQITSLETVGALKLNGVDVTLNQVISRADIDAGLLTFAPISNQNGVSYDSFDFKVHDGTAYSAASYTLTIDVTAVNDLPTATNNTVVTNEDTTYVFNAADFNFNDVDIGDTLQQIQVTSLETVGALKLNGVDVTLNQVISRADIDAGLLTFDPINNQNGAGYDSFRFQVHDGTTYSVATYTINIDVNAVNDLPTATNNTVSTNEDVTYVFSASDFNFADVDVGDTLQQIRITSLETVGDLKLNGVDVTLNQVISRADIDAGLLTFAPISNQNGVGYDSFDFKVHDGSAYSAVSYSMTVDVNAVNDAPTATNNTVSTNEDVTYVFGASDFNLADVDVGDTLQQIRITSLETVGDLKLNGVDVTLNQVISRADIDAGLLTFAPISNQSGVGYDSFDFKVHDGTVYSAATYTLTIDVTPLNDLPTATNNTVSTNEDVTYVFNASDFNFADNDIGDTLQQIQVTSLETVGALKLNGVDVTLNQVISRADVDAGLLTFMPVANQNGVSYDSFDFKVHDGTAYSAASYTLTIDVSSVADLPTATNSTVVTNEDTTYVFSASDFNFADVDIGDTLQQIQVTSLETVGALTLNGVDVTLNQVISRADIDAGLLTFAPISNQNGVSYDSFDFKVHDGTAYSAASYTLTIDVTAVNDLPTATNNTVSTNEDVTYVFGAADFNFADVDVGDTLQQIRITSLETVGDLKLNGVDVTLNQVISRADIDAGLLTFAPISNQNGVGYDSFDFKVHDGSAYSAVSYSMTVDVNAVNDAPTATNNTVATNEDVTYVFGASDFNFADVDVGDTLQQIRITSLETVGDLKLNGVDVTLNQVISRADIDAGLLTFAPISNQSGVGYDSFDFKVHDGTVYSAATYTLTIDVTPIK